MQLATSTMSLWCVRLVLVLSVTFSQPAMPQPMQSCDGFCLIDNFDNKLNGSIRSQGEWQTNPAGAMDGAIVTDTPPSPISGKALMIDPNGVQFRGNTYLSLADKAIREGSTGTLFFQIYIEDLNDSYSHFGLTDLANPRLTDGGSGQVALYTDFEAQFSLNRGRFSVKHGQETLFLTNINPASATLYNIWMVVNNSTDTYEIYVQGGAHSTVTKGSSGFTDGRDHFEFRNGQALADLQTIYSITSPDTVLHSKRYIDNIYVDPDQENLTNPVPSVSTHEQFVEITTFDSLEPGALDGQGGWSGDLSNIVIDPLNTTNKVLQVSSGNASKQFSGIENQGEGTLFFRMMRNGLVNASAGISDVAAPTEFSDYENQLNVQNNAILNIRDGGQFQAIDTFAADVWYCVWMMTDNGSDRYEVYMKGGTLTEPTRLDAGAETSFSYRNGSDVSLSTFFAKTQQSDGNFFIDDLYYSGSGANLELPGRNNCSSDFDTVSPQPLADPIPETISKSGVGVVVEEFVTIPSSNSDSIPQARINFLDHANDNSGRLFVNDLRHKMYVIDANSAITEYLNLAANFTDFVDSPRLGSGFGFFAFHPEFSNNGKFYTVHTEAGGALSNKIPDYSSNSTDSVHGVITEWTARQPGANYFLGSKREILRIGFNTFLHGFQQIGFNRTAQVGSGDYGLLYIATGDGQENPNFTSSPQDLSLPHGKILRIDPLGSNAANGQYGIPSSNPFTDTSGALGEIWAYGLRNPHRFSWDSGGTNRMFIGHIGEKNIDAIYAGFAGANYGWTEREGSFLFKINDPNNVYSLPNNDAQHGYTYPVAQYDHDEGFATVGGFVYRGASIPALNGKYIFGDIVNGRIFYTEESKMITGESPTTIHELTLFDSNDNERDMRYFAGHSRVDLRLGLDASGELYFLSKTNGKIWRITSRQTINNAPLLSRIKNQNNTIGDEINIMLIATDLDGDSLQFEATGLPDGLSINSDGEISGRPLATGSFFVTVSVSDTDSTIDTERFEWTIEALDDSNGATPEFIAQIQSASTGFCIGIRGADSSDGANVDSTDCIADDAEAAHQRLYFIPITGVNNTYTLEFEHSGLCLAVPDGSNANGVSLQQQNCNNTRAQQFRIINEGANHAIYTNTGTGEKVVDSHATTHNIIQWQDYGNSNQRWIYYAYEPYTTELPAEESTTDPVDSPENGADSNNDTGDFDIRISTFSTVPSEADGRRARLISLTNDGVNLYAISSIEGKIYKISRDSADLWFDVKQALGNKLNTRQSGEGGVRSLAFHPDYANNRKFYTSELQNRPQDTSGLTYLSEASEPDNLDGVITEWTHNIDGTFTQREVLRIAPPGPHRIKQIAFNPYAIPTDDDYGLLFIAHGDGGHWRYPLGGHNNDALGKILRINPLAEANARYSIPADNPFIGNSQILDEVYAIGFRSPHNLSFTKSGQLISAEIGNRNAEEINFVDAGGNYGWKEREGNKVYLSPDREIGVAPLPDNDVIFGYIYPVAQIEHHPEDGPIAIAGGYPIENGSELSGIYLYGEFASTGELYYSFLTEMEQAITTGNPENLQMAPTQTFSVLFDHDSDPLTTHLIKDSMLDVINDSPLYTPGSDRADLRFGRGPSGEVYITSKQNNTIYLVENTVPPLRATDETEPTVTLDTSVLSTFVSSPINITGSADDDIQVQRVELTLTNSDGQYFNGTSFQSDYTRVNASGTSTWSRSFSLDPGSYTVTPVAFDTSNKWGATAPTMFTVGSPDDTAPTVTLLTPTPGSRVLSPIDFTGSANDDVEVQRIELAIVNSDGQYYNGTTFQTDYARIPASGTSTWARSVTLSSGTYFVTPVAFDPSNNWGANAPFSFAVGPADNIKPTVEMNSPQAAQTNSAPFIITGTASDNLSVARVEIALTNSDGHYWNGSSWQADYIRFITSGTTNWTAQINAPNGNYTATPVAFDSANNWGATAPFSFTVGPVDNIKPIVEMNSPLVAQTSSTPFFITGTASDNLSVARVEIALTNTDGQYWNGSSWQANYIRFNASGTTNWTAQINAPNGNYTATPVAFDSAKNWGSIAPVKFTISQ